MASLIRKKDPGKAWETEVDTGGNDSQVNSRWNGYGNSSLTVPNDESYHIANDWGVNSQDGSDINVDGAGLFSFVAGLYLFMLNVDCVPANGATHLIGDWRTNSGIVAGDVGFGQQAFTLGVNKDNGAPADLCWAFWLKFFPSGTVDIGFQTLGSSGNETVAYAIDIVRVL